jgi:spore germination protein GerM
MKKIICLLLSVAILLLSSCSIHGQEESAVAPFYYLRDPDTFLYGSPDGVVSSENRDIAGHENELNYLLMLYLKGPLDEGLESPFPEGCRLLQLNEKNGKLSIVLNSSFTTLKGMDLTLACVCMARTCFTLTDAESIRIMGKSAHGTILIDETITINSLLLEDTALPTESRE